MAAGGLAEREQGTRMTTDARMLAGSVGKLLVVAVTRALVKRGALAIDTPVATVLGSEPWYKRLPNPQIITLRHLLTHSSGIRDHINEERFARDLFARLAAGELDWYPRPLEAVEYVLDREPRFAPGQGYEYTDTGYFVVGLVLERVSGRSFYELARELVIEPLGLDRTAPSDRRALTCVRAPLSSISVMDGVMLDAGQVWRASTV